MMVEAPVLARQASRDEVHDYVWFSLLVVSILLAAFPVLFFNVAICRRSALAAVLT